MGAYTKVIELELFECGECGVPFGLTQTTVDSLKRSKKTFHCPNGHRRWFPGKTDEQKLKEEIRRKDEQISRERAERRAAEQLVEAERRSKANVKGQLTKLKKRVANGVCPCCNRTFVNVHKHISRQHPDYAE